MPRFRLSTVALKQIALAKLADITVISADFHGETAVFEPWLSLLIDTGDTALFTGVYRPSFSADDAAPDVPDLCWRRSQWSRDTDAAQVGDAPDRPAYLAGDTQIVSTIQFNRLDRQPNLAALIQRTVAQFASGVSVAATRRPDAAWHRLQVTVADDSLACRIDYSPLLAQSDAVETWLPQWLGAIDDIDGTRSSQPDADITISYRRSLPELLAATRGGNGGFGSGRGGATE